MTISLALSQSVHEDLYKHLFPGDGFEAIAVAICGRCVTRSATKIVIHKIIKIPYDECTRNEGYLNWSTQRLVPFFEMVMHKDMAMLKIHSHPGGFPQFSETDDVSDQEFFESVYGWSGSDRVHGSAVMLPTGEIFGRAITSEKKFIPFKKISVCGNQLKFFFENVSHLSSTEFSLRTLQAFGQGTVNILKNLTVAVVGCSGTGSPVIEQLVRLGIGKLLLIDPDIIEEKNLNRILNSSRKDALNGVFKVDALKKAIENIDVGTTVESYAKNLFDEIELLKKLALCDVIFGCLDTIDGRHLLNQLATFYLIPYFDVGVRLTADGKGGIDQILGTVHYLTPGKGSLLTRGVYTIEGLRSAGLFRTNPKEYYDLRTYGYIANSDVPSPAVVSVNMLAASIAVNEFLARIHQYRNEGDDQFEITRFSLSDGYFFHESDDTIDQYLEKYVGRGDMIPFLNMPEFSFIGEE
ncbi:ThiF family adenylyltransferase [Fulvivirgaceae bacterium PWU4]|uniref:ThiF family adenylyltransferase n=1 Tax=Chryseosolibacter histidini TaxID=2782349 RepID=A0AAP2GIL7_9BACT|nr:ThiF family adenylyltransferase [Chryseosolibacter histidini]MBT1697149.1 ThiF family adenylyltransferase [Chryseosolibacter histidini]